MYVCVFSDEQKLTCTFEQGMCFWRQEQDEDDGDWIRTRGAAHPPLSGPSIDHTLGNSSGVFTAHTISLLHAFTSFSERGVGVKIPPGFFVVTPPSPGQWQRSFRMHSLRLTAAAEPTCLSFW